MAICTKCGAVFPDFSVHTCKEENVPKQNEEKFGLVIVSVKPE